MENSRPNKTTKPGTKPNDSKKARIPGSGKNRPAKGYNPLTKKWER